MAGGQRDAGPPGPITPILWDWRQEATTRREREDGSDSGEWQDRDRPRELRRRCRDRGRRHQADRPRPRAGRAHRRLQRQDPVPRRRRRAHPCRVRADGPVDRRRLPLVHGGRRLRRDHDDLRLCLPGTRPVAPGLPRPLEQARREVGDRLRPPPDDLPARRAHALRDAGLRSPTAIPASRSS